MISFVSKDLIQAIRGKLIVSCQALRGEPLHGAGIMARMAAAAREGGAGGIRANDADDIRAIKQAVELPLIGIIKEDYPDSQVYITPTLREAEALAEAGADIIAMDATGRARPRGGTLEELYRQVRERFPERLLMADCSTYEEGLHAAELGFDLIGTTLCGYTPYTRRAALPDYNLLRRLVMDQDKPVIAEGGVTNPWQLREVMNCGAHAAVVGTAITRPQEITRRFVKALETEETEFDWLKEARMIGLG